MLFAKTKNMALAAAAFTAAGAGFLHADTTQIEVPKDYLLVWHAGRVYQTTLNVKMSLTDASFSGKIRGLPIEGKQERAFDYKGLMLYTTEMKKADKIDGSAWRFHNTAYLDKVPLSKPDIQVSAGAWTKFKSWFDNGIPEHLKDDFEIFRREKPGIITVRPKPGKGNEVLEKVAPGFKDIIEVTRKFTPSFTRAGYTLGWTAPEDFKLAALTVKTQNGGGSTMAIRDLINREVRFLYTNILQDANRKDGDAWVVRAEDLDAMIHADMEGWFKGKVIVKAKWIEYTEKAEMGATPFTGWKLEFVKDAMTSSGYQSSEIEFCCKDVDGNSQSVKLSPVGRLFTGELWLDTNYEMIRYGRLTCTNTQYRGKMPRMKDLNNESGELDAKIYFDLTYVQAVSDSEGQTE